MMKPLLLFLAGLLMEVIWAVGVVALQRKIYSLAFISAGAAPYVTMIASAWTVVDEPEWGSRIIGVTYYALGAVVGLAGVLMWRKSHPN